MTEDVPRAKGFPVTTLAFPRHCQELLPRVFQVLASRKLRPLVNQDLIPDTGVSVQSGVRLVPQPVLTKEWKPMAVEGSLASPTPVITENSCFA